MDVLVKTKKQFPTKDEVKALRARLNLTQAQCAEFISVIEQTWQRYEYGDRAMSPVSWELFKLKTASLIS